MASEPSHVKLVNHGLGEGPLERQIALPVIPIGIGYDAFHGQAGIVSRPRRSPPVVSFWDCYSEPVRIEEHLLGVETISMLRGEWPMRPVGIYLPRLEAWYKCMPIVMGAVIIRIERDHSRGLGGIPVIEQKQLDQRCTFREHAEVDAAGTDGRAERSTRARCDDAAAHDRVMLSRLARSV